MITSNLRQEIATTIKPSLLFKISYPIIVLVKVLLFKITEKRFYRYVLGHIKKLKKTDFRKLTLKECSIIFNFLENDLLRKWYVTLENDFFVMTYLGILQNLYTQNDLPELLLVRSKATEQVGHLADLSKLMQSVPEIWSAVLAGDDKLFEVTLKRNLTLQDKYKTYLEEFGGRFANELKLETIGIDEDVKKFMAVLRAYSTYEYVYTGPKTSRKMRLPLFKKILFEYSLKKFKKYASQRENFRLLRSNMFSITRSVFRRVGVILEEKGFLENAEDIFYMTVAEVLAVVDGNISPDLLPKVTERKQNFSDYKNESPSSHFLTIGGGIINNDNQTSSESVIARGVSSGIISGRVKVMKEFEMPNQIDFEILVTKHTDPGWTALIALSKGLIIEHGGVLSHASIVARELGIPAVIGVRGATDFYRDGQWVEINGSTGTIRVV